MLLYALFRMLFPNIAVVFIAFILTVNTLVDTKNFHAIALGGTEIIILENRKRLFIQMLSYLVLCAVLLGGCLPQRYSPYAKMECVEVKPENLSVEQLTHLGLRYLFGQGVPVDYAAAFQLTELAAKRGYPGAEKNLGNMYMNGIGVPRNPHAAFVMYRSASMKGFVPAYSSLSTCYANGEGVAPDPSQAFYWAYQAAVQNESLGQLLAGWSLLTGFGTQINYAYAFNFLRSAAAKGNLLAITYLGVCYAIGAGTPQNINYAIQLWQSAAMQGDTFAYDLLNYTYQRGIPSSNYAQPTNLQKSNQYRRRKSTVTPSTSSTSPTTPKENKDPIFKNMGKDDIKVIREIEKALADIRA